MPQGLPDIWIMADEPFYFNFWGYYYFLFTFLNNSTASTRLLCCIAPEMFYGLKILIRLSIDMGVTR